VEEGVDSALRLGELPDSSPVATRISATEGVFAASLGYLRAHGDPKSPAELRAQDCIGVQGLRTLDAIRPNGLDQ
jgi:hypothetical protein